MLNILSVGITSSQNGLKCDCAYNDALCIYNVFSQICANKFSTYNSLCVNNLKYEDYLKMLDVLKGSVKDDDVFVLYFSGHGILSNEKFYLQFYDDRLSLNSIKEKIDDCKGHIVVILDCCFAGGALFLANREGLFNSSHISVLASSNTDATSKYDVDGSLFTRYLVWALRNLYLHRDHLTLNSIVKKIGELGYRGCNVNVEEGKADLNLCQIENPFDSSMSERFVAKLKLSNFELRENLFYTIKDYSMAITLEAIKKYIRERSELSWVVRRAIGSQLSLLVDDKEVFDYCLAQLSNNMDWTVKIICAIALRYKVKTNNKIKDLFLEIINNKASKIDLVWLIALYLCENPDQTICDAIFKTNLMETDWGKLEIIKSLGLVGCEKGYSMEIFKEYISPRIQAHWGMIDDNILIPEMYKSTMSSELAKTLYKARNRGRFSENSRDKQLLSLLFGYYRYSILTDLSDYFISYNDRIIFDELVLAQNLPLVEMRMEIFHFFQVNQSLLTKYCNAIEWGLIDEHPWVQREAVKAFAPKYKDLCKSKLKLKYSDTYPGYFDLAHELIKDSIDISDFISQLTLSELEKKSLDMEMMANGEK